MKTAWLTIFLSNKWRLLWWRVIPLMVAATAASVMGWSTGFASPFDLILVGWSTMSATQGITWFFYLRQLPADVKNSMNQKGEGSSLFWVFGANAIMPMFLKLVIVSSEHPEPWYMLAVILGGFLLLASVLIIQYVFRRFRRKSDVSQDNSFSEPEA